MSDRTFLILCLAFIALCLLAPFRIGVLFHEPPPEYHPIHHVTKGN